MLKDRKEYEQIIGSCVIDPKNEGREKLIDLYMQNVLGKTWDIKIV